VPTPQPPQAVILVTGIQASGKSTIAQLLAERLPQSVHVRSDLFRRMIINGRADMTPDPASEAVRQLRLRHQLAATVSDAYFQAGFTVIVQDVILGAHLAEMTAMIRSRPLLVIVLAPKAGVIADREQGRGKTAYGTWAIAQLDDILRNETPRLGLWLDTSTQTPLKPPTRFSPAPGRKPAFPAWTRERGRQSSSEIPDSASGSHARSHRNEQPRGCPDSDGQRAATRAEVVD
jgi:predicted kinase